MPSSGRRWRMPSERPALESNPSARVVSKARLTASFAIRDAESDIRRWWRRRLSPLREGLGRHDARDQPAALRLLGIHVAPRQDQVHRLGLADGAGEPLRPAHAGQDAELDFGLAEFRGVGGDQQITHHRQLTAAAECIAGDRGDRGRARRGEFGPLREEVGGEHLGERQVGHLLDVRAGRECLLVSGHDVAPMPGSLSNSAAAAVTSSITWPLSALSALGRFSVMVPTRSSRATRMVS